jgi:hypothetical protein
MSPVVLLCSEDGTTQMLYRRVGYYMTKLNVQQWKGRFEQVVSWDGTHTYMQLDMANRMKSLVQKHVEGLVTIQVH